MFGVTDGNVVRRYTTPCRTKITRLSLPLENKSVRIVIFDFMVQFLIVSVCNLFEAKLYVQVSIL